MPLFLYGELSFEEEERLEVHIDECAGCRDALARDKAMMQVVGCGGSSFRTQELLDDCRAELHQRLANVQPEQAGFWDKVREGFSVHFHFAPGWMQPVGAVAMLLLGFVAARMTPGMRVSVPSRARAGGEPVTSRVRYVEPVLPGSVQIVVDETRQRVLSGRVEDQSIQRLLLTAAKDPSDAGTARGVGGSAARTSRSRPKCGARCCMRCSMIRNAGVRLKALDGLKDFADDPETRQVLTKVLLKDDNPGVRTQVIDLLIQQHTNAMVGVLQELMMKEDNDYIRMRVPEDAARNERFGGDLLSGDEAVCTHFDWLSRVRGSRGRMHSMSRRSARGPLLGSHHQRSDRDGGPLERFRLYTIGNVDGAWRGDEQYVTYT